MDAIKLTKRVVDAAIPRTDRYTLFDSAIPGFGLRVYPSGQKSWVFEYRPGEGGRGVSKKRITIGKVSDFTPDGARKVADGLRSAVKMGEDPQGEKARQREAPTLAEIAKTFLRDHVGAKRKPSTQLHYQDVIERLVVPALGNLKAKDITRAEVARLHLLNVATPFQANRILAIVGSMYAFASKHGLVPEGTNPARGVERFKEESRERFLSVDELERLGTSIRLAETVGIPWVTDDTKNAKHLPKSKRETPMSKHAAAAIRLLILTGARLRGNTAPSMGTR